MIFSRGFFVLFETQQIVLWFFKEKCITNEKQIGKKKYIKNPDPEKLS